jgi:hypothetical protein
METIYETILRVLENNNAHCLDELQERIEVADELSDALSRLFIHAHDWVPQITGEDEKVEACKCGAMRTV